MVMVSSYLPLVCMRGVYVYVVDKLSVEIRSWKSLSLLVDVLMSKSNKNRDGLNNQKFIMSILAKNGGGGQIF